MHRRTRWLCGVTLLLAVAGGCNSKPAGPPTVPVTGTVMMKQKPVEGASVIFYPVDTSGAIKPVQAVTDAEGKFTMKTFVAGSEYKDGMQTGDYVVTVSKTEPQPPGVYLPPKELLPAKFTQPQTSPFKETIPAGGKTCQLEIK